MVGELDIDRFVTATNRLLPKYNSYFWEEGCAGVDAFAQSDWDALRNYCNPPFSQVGRLVTFLQQCPGRIACAIIAPKWVS